MLAGANSDFTLVARYLHSEGICLCNYFEPDSISESCRILALRARGRGSGTKLWYQLRAGNTSSTSPANPWLGLCLLPTAGASLELADSGSSSSTLGPGDVSCSISEG